MKILNYSHGNGFNKKFISPEIVEPTAKYLTRRKLKNIYLSVIPDSMVVQSSCNNHSYKVEDATNTSFVVQNNQVFIFHHFTEEHDEEEQDSYENLNCTTQQSTLQLTHFQEHSTYQKKRNDPYLGEYPIVDEVKFSTLVERFNQFVEIIDSKTTLGGL